MKRNYALTQAVALDSVKLPVQPAEREKNGLEYADASVRSGGKIDG
jgi:hypothetical protein